MALFSRESCVDFANGSHFAGGVIRPTLYTDCGLSAVPGME